jgi:hypothetical protein
MAAMEGSYFNSPADDAQSGPNRLWLGVSRERHSLQNDDKIPDFSESGAIKL